MSLFIRRFLNINYRQAPNFRLLALTFLVFIIGLVWAENAIYAELINVKLFPTAKLISSTLVIVFSLLYTTLVDSMNKARMFVAITIIGIIAIIPANMLILVNNQQIVNYGFIAFWVIYELLFYIWVIHWGTFILDTYDSRIVKRIFPLLGAARPIGTIVSSVTFNLFTGQFNFSTNHIIYMWLLSLIVVLILLLIVNYRLEQANQKNRKLSVVSLKSQSGSSVMASVKNLWEGLDIVGRSSFLRWMALSALLMVGLNTLTREYTGNLIFDYFQAQGAVDPTIELAQLTALWKGIGSVGALILQVFIFGRMMKIFGMRNMILAFPLLAVIASIGLVSLPVLLPALVLFPAIYARVTRESLRRVFRDPVVGLLANAVPPNAKGRARAVINGLISPAGGIVASALLVTIPEDGNMLPVILLLSALLYFISAIALRQEYARAMVSMLQSQSYRFLLSQSDDVDVLESGIRNETVVTDLVSQINTSDDPDFQLFLLQILCETGSETALDTVTNLMQGSESEFRAQALKTYIDYGLLTRAGHEYFIALTHDDSAKIRKLALQGIDVFYGDNDKRYLKIIHDVLRNDPEPIVQLQVIPGLLIQRRNKMYKLDAKDSLHRFLQSENHELLLLTLDAVEWIGQAEYISDIIRLIDSENDEVRYRATQVIRSLWRDRLSPQTYQQLLAISPAFLEDPVEKIRLEELYLLAHFRHNDSYTTLARALSDPAMKVREAAIASFANMGSSALPFLESLLTSENTLAVRGAKIALCQINPQKYKDAVLQHIRINLEEIYENKRRLYALHPYSAFASVRMIDDTLYTRINQALDDIFYLLESIDSRPQSGIKVLRDSLESDSVNLRSDALETLEALTSPQITRLVAPLFEPETTLADLAQIQIEGVDDFPDAFTVLNQYRHENVYLDAAMIYAFAEIASIHPDLSSITFDKKAPARNFSLIEGKSPTLPDDITPSQRMDIRQIMVAIRVSMTSKEPLVKSASLGAMRLLQGESLIADELEEGENTMLSTVECMIILKKVPLFASISTEQLKVLASICVENFFNADDVLFYEGDHSSELYVVVTGDVRVGLYNEDKSDFTSLADYSDGSAFGEMTLFQSGTRTASAVAVSDVFILTIQNELLMVLLHEYPELAIQMLKTLSGYLVATNIRVSELSPHTSHE